MVPVFEVLGQEIFSGNTIEIVINDEGRCRRPNDEARRK